MTLNPFKWLRQNIAEISAENQHIRDLDNEAKRILQEIQLSAEGREAECLSPDESFQITIDLLTRQK